MSDTNQLSIELAQLAMMEKFVAAKVADKKREIQEQVARGTVYATMPDGSEVATVVAVAEKVEPGKLFVANEQAFLTWCIEHHPTSIDMKVRSLDQEKILAEALKTGEVPDGVEMGDDKVKAGYVQIKQSPAQLATIRDLWASGRMEIDMAPPVIVGELE